MSVTTVVVDVADREDAPEAPGGAPVARASASGRAERPFAAAEEDVDDAVAVGGADDEVGIRVAVEVAGGERGAEAAAAGQLGALGRRRRLREDVTDSAPGAPTARSAWPSLSKSALAIAAP